eukprot:1140840-Pelagomonas_calceolata.AAC.3
MLPRRALWVKIEVRGGGHPMPAGVHTQADPARPPIHQTPSFGNCVCHTTTTNVGELLTRPPFEYPSKSTDPRCPEPFKQSCAPLSMEKDCIKSNGKGEGRWRGMGSSGEFSVTYPPKWPRRDPLSSSSIIILCVSSIT